MTLPAHAALGTMHGKELAIAPPLAALGVTLIRPEIDTDRFGTFTGETPRLGTMADAARSKARAAIAATGLPIGIASEGAYGPHPSIPFLPLGRELLLWHEAETGREIIEQAMDDRPNYDHARVASLAEAEPLLARVAFPATAIIVAPSANALPVAKGLRDHDALAAAIEQAVANSADGSAFLQTDMRAHMNPRRMEVIAGLATRLAQRLSTPCPQCRAPGWGLLRRDPGLPCGDCGTPTALVAQDIHGCTACGAEDRCPRTGIADPAQCPYCNP
jgi:hypothetical protein